MAITHEGLHALFSGIWGDNEWRWGLCYVSSLGRVDKYFQRRAAGNESQCLFSMLSVPCDFPVPHDKLGWTKHSQMNSRRSMKLTSSFLYAQVIRSNFPIPHE